MRNGIQTSPTEAKLRERRTLFLLWLLMLGVRVACALLDSQGLMMEGGDSVNYYQSGLLFARTGQLRFGGRELSALVMPGTTVLVGVLSRFFSDGQPLQMAIRLTWALFGSFTPLFIYKSVRLFTPRWCALLTALIYVHPLFILIDSYMLTEGPNYMFFAMSLYYTLKMGEEDDPRDIWKYSFSVLGGLLFRTFIISAPLFTLAYLGIIKRRYSLRAVVQKAGVICLVLALFILPWTARNYRIFHAFIPLTYGAGNPIMEGTDQGDGYPAAEIFALGVENIDEKQVIREKYSELFDENGDLLDPELAQYVFYLGVSETARFRINTWLKYKTGNFLKTYLWVKPRAILNWPWYWENYTLFPYAGVVMIRRLNCLFCLLTAALALLLKRHRRVILFLGLAYLINLYVISFGFAIDRYAQAIMPYRYIAAGIGMDLAAEAFRRKWGGLRPASAAAATDPDDPE